MKGFELTTFGTSVFYHKHETKLKKSRCGPFEFRSRAIVHGMHFSSFENFLLFRIAFTFSGVSLCVSYTSIWWRSRKCRFCRVTRLGNLLHFGQLFKACGINYFEKLPTSWGNYCKGVKIFHFSGGIILGNFCKHLATDWFCPSFNLRKGLCNVCTSTTMFFNLISNIKI